MGLVTQSNLHVIDFPGVWHCRYWFPSNTHPGEDVSEYYARILRGKNGFTLYSLPNTIDAYLQAHFAVDSNLATGSWLEDTSPEGEFGGMVYSGVFQVIISEDVRQMTGCWVGVGKSAGVPQLYNGRWEITYLGETTKGLPEL